jgi:hypothetical protein
MVPEMKRKTSVGGAASVVAAALLTLSITLPAQAVPAEPVVAAGESASKTVADPGCLSAPPTSGAAGDPGNCELTTTVTLGDAKQVTAAEVKAETNLLPGHGQRAIHERIAREWGTTLGFVEWFDDTYGNLRDSAGSKA